MKANLSFGHRIENYEVRSCDNKLMQSSGDHVTGEIIKWSGENCYTLAYWVKDSEEFYLKFVGDRPLNENKDIFWKLITIGQGFLDQTWDEQ